MNETTTARYVLGRLRAAWMAFRNPQLVSDGLVVRQILTTRNPDACALLTSTYIGNERVPILEMMPYPDQVRVRELLRGLT